MSLDATLKTIREHAESLRAAGVVRFEVNGCKVWLDGPAPTPTEAKPTPDHDEEYADPLDDPATFGLRGGRVPGYRRRSEDE